MGRSERRARLLAEQRALIDDATDSSEDSDFDDFDFDLVKISTLRIQHADITSQTPPCFSELTRMDTDQRLTILSSASSPGWMRSTRVMRASYWRRASLSCPMSLE